MGILVLRERESPFLLGCCMNFDLHKHQIDSVEMKKSEEEKITEAETAGLAGLILDAQPKLLGGIEVRRPCLIRFGFRPVDGLARRSLVRDRAGSR